MKSRSDDLEIFLQVALDQNFSTAAQHLNMTVAKVSRSIQRLESQLEIPLLTRTTRKVTLTTEGTLFADHVRQGMDQLNFAEQMVIEGRGKPKGRLRVDAASPFMLHQIVPHVAAFNREYPDIQLDLLTSEGIVDLIERRTDVAIRVGALDDSTLHRRTLGLSPLYIVASPAYVEKWGKPETVKDLSTHRLLGFTAPAALNAWPFKEGERHITPELAANSGEVIRQLCLQGNGIACLSYFMIAEDLKAGRLLSCLVDQLSVTHPRYQVNAVYYKNTALSNRIKAFLDFFAPKIQ